MIVCRFRNSNCENFWCDLQVASFPGIIEGNPVIVYGGVRKNPQRARNTEDFLKGKSIYDEKVM